MNEDLAAGAQAELRATIGVFGTETRLQVRIGDLLHSTPFPMPSLLTDETVSWRKGPLRKVLEDTIVYMANEIVKHRSLFKHRAHCTRDIKMMQPCPCAEEEP